MQDWWTSKAMWGSLLLSVLFIYNMIAGNVGWPTVSADPTSIGELANNLVAVIGLLLQIVGRITAKEPISTTSVLPGVRFGE